MSQAQKQLAPMINVCVRIQNKLHFIDVAPSSSVRNLKVLIQQKFRIPRYSQILTVNSKILKNKDDLSQFSSKTSTILLGFRLQGGMIEPLINCPLHFTEMLILDDQNKIVIGNQFDSSANPFSLPTNFICRIHSKISMATGFACQGASGEVFIITALHVENPVFHYKSKMYASFNENQIDLSYNSEMRKVISGMHRCTIGLFELEKVNILYKGPQNQIDPLTGSLYSLADDIVALKMTGFCICNAPIAPPALQFLRVQPTPPPHTETILFGFPGSLTDKSISIALAEEVKEADFENAQRNIIDGLAYIMEGQVLAKDYLSSISNPSTSGMSGSPLLVREGSEYRVCGMLLGGPAVPGHRDIIEMIQFNEARDRAGFNRKIADMSLISRDFSLRVAVIENEYGKDHQILEDSKILYYRMIMMEYERLLSLFGTEKCKEQLNHNLVIDFSEFIGLIP